MKRRTKCRTHVQREAHRVLLSKKCQASGESDEDVKPS